MFSRIFPVLTPLAVDSGRPFPYISNLSLNLAVLRARPATAHRCTSRASRCRRCCRASCRSRRTAASCPLEEVIAANLDQLFPGMEIVEHHTFRVTRNADLEIDDDGADDLLEALEEELPAPPSQPAVRLEVEEAMPPHVLELLMRRARGRRGRTSIPCPAPLDLAGLWSCTRSTGRTSRTSPIPVTHPRPVARGRRGDASIFEVIARPRRARPPSVRVVRDQRAALHRAGGGRSRRARDQADALPHRRQPDRGRADRGGRARQAGGGAGRDQGPLRRERQHRLGAHAGEGGLPRRVRPRGPEDALQALPGRARGGRRDLRRYVHVGTGNYNPITARIYEDIGLFTADPEVGRRGRAPVQLHHRLLARQEVRAPDRRAARGCGRA